MNIKNKYVVVLAVVVSISFSIRGYCSSPVDDSELLKVVGKGEVCKQICTHADVECSGSAPSSGPGDENGQNKQVGGCSGPEAGGTEGGTIGCLDDGCSGITVAPNVISKGKCDSGDGKCTFKPDNKGAYNYCKSWCEPSMAGGICSCQEIDDPNGGQCDVTVDDCTAW
jgi:hypothetical protein